MSTYVHVCTCVYLCVQLDVAVAVVAAVVGAEEEKEGGTRDMT